MAWSIPPKALGIENWRALCWTRGSDPALPQDMERDERKVGDMPRVQAVGDEPRSVANRDVQLGEGELVLPGDH